MMAPRSTVFGAVFKPSQPTLEQTISELQNELHQARSQLADEKFKRSRAEFNAARMKRNSEKPMIIPDGDCETGYECPVMGCHAKLIEDYSFCPGCGSEIDWGHWRYPQEDVNAYDRRFDR